MGKYTEVMDVKNISMDLDIEESREELIKIAESFRSFGEALDEFLVMYGYKSDITNVDEKISYINARFEEANIKVIQKRTIEKYFISNSRITDRETAFKFCFAFRLNIEQTNNFFGKTCLMRSFDCHYMKEAVYFFAISNNLSYDQANAIITTVALEKPGNKKLDYDGDVLFTSTIKDELKKFSSKEELIKYLNSNKENFGYNNATACAYIKETWEYFTDVDGLIFKETQEERGVSTWAMLRKILGLLDYDLDNNNQTYNLSRDDGLKTIIKENKLLNPLAEDCFPSRKGIEDIIKGKHVAHETVRKILIVVVFYDYWAKKIVDSDFAYEKDEKDFERCKDLIDSHLLESGYFELYNGNPYDWLFLYCLTKEEPLDTLRTFMQELYFYKQDEDELEIKHASTNPSK